MKLDRLKIVGFRNFSDLSVDFDDEQLTTVVVGRNGTGKSNLIEALILIFRHLDLNEKPPFRYEIEYICRGHRVHVDADPARPTRRVRIMVDGVRVPYSRFSKEAGGTYLPNHVFGYYSGTNDRLEAHFKKHQERFYDYLIYDKGDPTRRLFYARLVHSQFALLAFFIERDPYILAFLRENLRIEDLVHTLFVMREPDWENREKTGDSRFWHARGKVQEFLDILYETALAPLRKEQPVSSGIKGRARKEHLYLFLKDKAAIERVAGIYRTQGEFFEALESTYISELISEVKTRVRVKNASGDLTFRDLSEGEQQLLMVLGLLRFTKADESLFILDEPDTHLNPAWAIQYLELLQKVVGEQDDSHIIIATHNPLVIAGLERSQVLIMQRNEQTGNVSVDRPEQDPKGMGVAALLTSDVYGLRSQLDPPTLRLLDKKRELATQDELTSGQKEKLTEINRELEDLHFTDSFRDPMYELFVEAMSAAQKEEGTPPIVLTKEQQAKRKELAERIVRRLKRESQEKL